MCRILCDAKTANIGFTTLTVVQETRVPSRGMRQTDVYTGRETMSRYIDADALIESIKNTADLGGWIGEALYQIKQVAIKYINSAPSIDIVRCKECKLYEECEYLELGDDDFCSRGERKESE